MNYKEMKETYKDAVCLWREDGNYLVTGKDAEIVSKVLNYPGLLMRFPKNMFDQVLKAIVRNGYKVAVGG